MVSDPERRKERAVMSWSGGKDSAFALNEVLNDRSTEVTELLTTFSSDSEGRLRSTVHGVREPLIREQARAAGLEMRTVELPADASNQEYNDVMNDVVETYTEEGYDTVVFGDINLESVRSYREDRLRGSSLDGRWVLWERDTGKTARGFVAEFGATVVCVDSESFDDPERFVGREFDAAFLEDLPNDVDPCGENGEFHTFVHGAPFFDYSVEFEPGEYVEREVRDGRLVYCDLVPPG